VTSICVPSMAPIQSTQMNPISPQPSLLFQSTQNIGLTLSQFLACMTKFSTYMYTLLTPRSTCRAFKSLMMSSDSETLLSPIIVWFGPAIIHQTYCGNIRGEQLLIIKHQIYCGNRSMQEIVPIYMTTEG
jgi:hypothetical protein